MKSWQVAAKLFSKKGKPNKGKAQKFHAMGRYLQRFNKKLTGDEYYSIIKQIQSNKAIFVERQSNIVTLWKINIHDNDVIAIYDKKTHSIRTFLTIKMYKEGKLK
jgi:hypothetical protein